MQTKNFFPLVIAFLWITMCGGCKKEKEDAGQNTTDEYVVNTLAGSGTAGKADGTGTAAQFSRPADVATDGEGNVYVAEFDNFAVRKISPAGVVSTLAGGSVGYADGQGITAQFKFPVGVATDGQGNVYVADDTRIRKITPSGAVSTLAGNEIGGYAEGAGAAARFNYLAGITLDPQGNVYVLDNDINGTGTGWRIRKVTPAGFATTFATNVAVSQSIDADAQGNVYIGDGTTGGIIKYTPAGAKSIYKETGHQVTGLDIDAQGVVHYTKDFLNNIPFNQVFKISPTGTISTLAGTGEAGFADGPATSTKFNYPKGLATDNKGNVYVADALNHRIRKITKK